MFLARVKGKRESKVGSLSEHAFNGDGASVELNDSFHNRESQPAPRLRAILAGAGKEAVKDVWQICCIYPSSGVPDGEPEQPLISPVGE